MKKEKQEQYSFEEEKVARAVDKVLEEEDNQFFYAHLNPIQLLFNNPLQLDFKGLKRFVFITFGFLTLNGILGTLALLKFFFFENTSWQWLLITIVLTILATVFAGYKAYIYALGDAARIFYRRLLAPQLKKRFEELIQNAANMLRESPNADFAKDFTFKEDIYNTFPKFVAKIFIKFFEMIPVVEFLMNAKEYIMEDEKKASEMIYNQVNQAFEAIFAERVHLRWLRWLIPLNIILVVICITSLI